MLRVALVDGDQGGRQNLCLLLRAASVDVEEFVDPTEYMASKLLHEPHVAVVNMSFQHFDGLDILKYAVDQTLALTVFATLDCPSTEKTVAAMQIGAANVLEKPVRAEMIIMAAQGHTSRVKPLKTATNIREAQKALSSREKEVLKWLLANRTSKEIAMELGASVRTIQTHRARIYAKLGVSSQAELMKNWTI